MSVDYAEQIANFNPRELAEEFGALRFAVENNALSTAEHNEHEARQRFVLAEMGTRLAEDPLEGKS